MADEALVIYENGNEIVYKPEMVNVIKKTVAKNATNEELYMFLSLANRYNLDPFAKEIWFIKYNGETRIETGRDGYLSIAKKDPDFLGIQSFVVHENDTFELDVQMGEVVDVIHKFGHTERGEIVGAWAVAKTKHGNTYEYLPFSESKQANSPVWKKHPTLMMKKVVESVVLKRVAGISGLVTSEEMGTDIERYTEPKPIKEDVPKGIGDSEIIDAEIVPKKVKKSDNRSELTDKEITTLKNSNEHIKDAIDTLSAGGVEITKQNITVELDKMLNAEEIDLEDFKTARSVLLGK